MADDPFETVVEAHHPEIRRYLTRVTRRAAEADDLAQETFLRAYRSWHALPANANVRAWLFAIATNLSRNHFRGEQRRSRAHESVKAIVSERGHESTDGGVMFSEALGVVESVVERLPFKQRTAFVLRKIHELDYVAIGSVLDCSSDTARAHVFQALRKIRQSLDGHDVPRTEVLPR
ncbi:MAG: RNA polymerase sigma factor [Candidatus Rokubacteria bacterium]|nr:RNA polymerase sigma factor [Candidatus Rokubacteria bacterium]